jgi:hypothetical protein
VFESLGAQRLVALFVVGWLLFNFPLLQLWDREATVFGIPLFPAALFIAWGAVIAALGWIAERGLEEERGGEAPAPPPPGRGPRR